ncbi:MAG TPA: phosphatase PAP2-related protein [Bacteroidia bacterium]|nr:phosphatase PAP2-related protein [Bacteroidia bacterium]
MLKTVLYSIFPASISSLQSNWKDCWKFSSFRTKGCLSLFGLFLICLFIPRFFTFIQERQGYAMNDFFLARITARNFSWYIFPLIYSVIAICLINASFYPELLLRGLQAYGVLMIIRIFILFVLPLEPERSLIPLEDPFIGKLFYSGKLITKDLFFSGHVSTMFLMILINPVRHLRPYLIVATVLVASFILIQHVHYTVDVMAAPVFAWLSFRISGMNLFRVNRISEAAYF